MNHPASSQALDPARERALLLTLAGIQFAHILDFMIMMPLGPILMRELGVGTHEFGLLVSAYTFSAAFTGVLAAMFVDRFERKRLLLTMFALFALATLACGLAPGYWTLLAARGLLFANGELRAASREFQRHLVWLDARGLCEHEAAERHVAHVAFGRAHQRCLDRFNADARLLK